MKNVTISRRRFALGAGAMVLASGAHAQAYPDKPIRIIYNYAPGGSGDAVARYMAQQLSSLLGQQVIVDNRDGGGGTVGILAGARAAADGYTLLCADVFSVLQVPLLVKDTGFDPVRGLSPLGQLAVMPLVFLAHPSVPVHDIPSFLEYARKQPAGVDVASSGSLPELALAKLSRDGGIKLVYVGFRGAAPALQAVMAGHVKIYYSAPTPAIADYARAGHVRIIGVTTPQASPLYPGVMPVSDHVPGFVEEINIALWAPAGVPRDVASKLSAAIQKVTADPATSVKFQTLGLTVRQGGADDARRILLRDADNLRKSLENTPSFRFGQ